MKYCIGRVLVSLVLISTANGGRIRSLQTIGEPGILSQVLKSLRETITKAIHVIGSVVPLRGLASIASDVGVPGASSLQSYLTPAKSRGVESSSPSFKRKLASDFKDTVLSALLGILGYKDCLLKAACYGGKRLSSSVSGTSALTLLLSTISDQLPDSMTEIYSTLKNSIFYSDDCARYHCKHEDLTLTLLKEKLLSAVRNPVFGS